MPPRPEPGQLAIRLRSSSSELTRLAGWIHEVADKERLSPEASFRLDLCSAEAVGNVIEHGSEGSGESEIVVAFSRNAETLSLEVEDDGAAFDPLAVPAPPRAQTIEEAEPGGRGIPILRQFADECRYERRDGRNRLTMIVKLR